MKVFLRFMLEVLLFVVLSPLIVAFLLMWLMICIKAAHLIGGTIKDGLKVWVDYIKTGLKMNKDFIVNGL